MEVIVKMRNKVVIEGDVARIKCNYAGEEVWVTVDKCFLDMIQNDFLSLSVYRFKYPDRGYMLHVGEPRKVSEKPSRHRISLLHRFILDASSDEVVVFKDGNGLNCTLDNMELITRNESRRRNSVKAYAKRSKYYPGVSKVKTTGKFTARIKVDGHAIHLGTFPDVESAISARKQAEEDYWGW